MRSPDPSKPSYIAKVKKIVSDYNGDNVKVHVRWYYRPEEVVGGRKKFHGNKEVFLSDHRDVQAVDAIEGRCKIHTFKNYRKLETVGNDDFYSRLQYCSSTARFSPDRIAVYCICEMPYNPDEFMIQCDGCHDWFHPACIDMTVEAAREMEHFLCQSCLS
ncbi:Bromo adjacent homology (BAH) domain-containing protein [Cynara cardunculus var. scolymus]|uniref:Bromo adjacent homology (BAH) domain-containing protein n=2 Tax=Cynara cardunculus var. scolymus TaxID=59895 RepID=A0A103YKF1_CYNCS|nr:Bromo adjacent homology (BAH) domain-containing protein [Cynara cardunculus var. scolymus]